MSLTRIGSIGINTGIAFAGVTTIVTLNTANDALSIGATVNIGSGNLTVGSGVTISSDGDGFFTGVITATSYSGIDLSDVTGATGDFSIADKIVHTGDTDTAIRFPNADVISFETAGADRFALGTSEVVVNDPGNDIDFRIEGDSDTNLFKVDAGNDRIGIGEASPDVKLHVRNDNSAAVKIGGEGGSAYYIEIGQLASSGSPGFNATGSGASMLFQMAGSEKLRIGPSGQIGIGGATYGSSGQVLTSGGSGSAVSWTTISGTTINSNTNNYLITGTGTANTLQGESGLTYDGDNFNVSAGAHDSGLHITAANNNQETRFSLIGKASDGTSHTFLLNAKRSANRLDLVGGGQTRASLKSTGEFGIGTVIQESLLTVGGGTVSTSTKSTVHIAPSSGNAMVTLRGGSPSVFFDITSGGNPKIYTDGADLTISNGTLDSAGNERFRFRSDGGICFNGDTAAANALDDYEEGEYTANVRVTSGSATFDSGSGNKLYYTKIGDIVYVNGGFTASSVSGAGGNLQFSLPFATKNSSSGVAKGVVGAIWNYYGSNNPYGNYGWYPLHGEGMNANVSTNITLAILGYNSQNSNWGPIGGLIGNNSQVHFSFTYRTN